MSQRRRPKTGPSLFEHADILDRLSGDWFDMVSVRRSRRTFNPTPLDDSTLSSIDEICRGFRPFSDARVELWKDTGADLFRGVIGSYGKVVGAPHVLAFIAGPGHEGQLHLGYTGEALLLEATRLGLGTCWVGGFYRHGAAEELASLNDGEHVFAISPLGHASEKLSASERLLRGASGSHSRRTVEQIAPGYGEHWPCWARVAVECARLAPSARNRQPWRFRMEAGDLVIERDGSIELPLVTKTLDCGIAMLHAELGARAAGVLGAWTELESAKDGLASFRADGSSPKRAKRSSAKCLDEGAPETADKGA